MVECLPRMVECFKKCKSFLSLNIPGIIWYTLVVAGILLIVIELESFSTLTCTLLYTGVQLERHRTSKHQDHGNNVIYSV